MTEERLVRAEDFDFDLPASRIAQTPAVRRTDSLKVVLNQWFTTASIGHLIFVTTLVDQLLRGEWPRQRWGCFRIHKRSLP